MAGPNCPTQQPPTATFLRSNCDLCQACRGINYESLIAPGGYRHTMTLATIEDVNHPPCMFCVFLKQNSTATQLEPGLDKESSHISLSIKRSSNESFLTFGIVSSSLTGSESSITITTMNEAPVTDAYSTTRHALFHNTPEPSLKIAEQWLDECRRNHHCSVNFVAPELEDLSNHQARQPPRQILDNYQSRTSGPRRLVDLMAFGGVSFDAQLVELNSISPEYAALSYCWGTVPQRTYQTTSTTLSSRMSRITYSEMPLTIQHAFRITKYMGIRYIWIDALCIVQGSKLDWEEESSKMGIIYGRAIITIAADWGDSVDSGCFIQAPYGKLSCAYNESEITSTLTNGEESSLFFYNKHWTRFSDVEESKLSTRGWAYQERILSARIIHFTKNQLFWECRNTTLAEDGFPRSDRKNPLIFGNNRPVTLRNMSPMDLWYSSITQNFVRRQLTFSSDKLPAISDIARLWASRLNCLYLAGIWEKDIHLGLAWHVVSPSLCLDLQPSEYRCPTWSWASIDAPSFLWFLSSENETEPMIQLIDANVTLESADPYGRVTAGFIKVTGRINRFILTSDGLHLVYMVREVNLTEYSYVKMDFKDNSLQEAW